MSRDEATLTSCALEQIAQDETRADSDDLRRVAGLIDGISEAMTNLRLAEFDYEGVEDGDDVEDLIDDLGDSFMTVNRDPLIDRVIPEAVKHATTHDTYVRSAPSELNVHYRHLARQALLALQDSE